MSICCPPLSAMIFILIVSISFLGRRQISYKKCPRVHPGSVSILSTLKAEESSIHTQNCVIYLLTTIQQHFALRTQTPNQVTCPCLLILFQFFHWYPYLFHSAMLILTICPFLKYTVFFFASRLLSILLFPYLE